MKQAFKIYIAVMVGILVGLSLGDWLNCCWQNNSLPITAEILRDPNEILLPCSASRSRRCALVGNLPRLGTLAFRLWFHLPHLYAHPVR